MTRTIELPMALTGLLMTFAGACLATSAGATTPASPELDRTSRDALIAELERSGIDGTASSAVLIALERVLGMSAADRTYGYRERYPQLPDVDAAARKVDDKCVHATLIVRPKAEPRTPVPVDGYYCLDQKTPRLWRERPAGTMRR